ncbi:C39 family peptidase [Candidatus Chloroploca sp. M-50]|uniref:C39 family peptidase n=2 Tax=Candidatus Chloroploca mongolica TaxID=2528176 RepID=A0ABS4D458_9CHLR|nr:C39 family peptidase [Candidatus Chloroploca mongolica]
MPNVLLPVPHYRQSRDGYCLPACVRMVLAYWGDLRDEATLARQLGTKRYGTPMTAVTRLALRHRYEVQLTSLTDTLLQTYLDRSVPVLARVWTAMLPDCDVVSSHVLVVVGYDEGGVYVNDPAFDAYPLHVPWAAFLAAWAEFDETAVIVTKTGVSR